MIEIAAEVVARIGAAAAARVETESGEYLCAVCHVAGNPSREATSLLLGVAPSGVERMVLAHTSCAPSQVVEGISEDTSGSVEVDVATLALTLAVRGKQRAFLLVQSRRATQFITVGGDAFDPWTAELLQQGWGLSTDIEQRARRLGAGWRVWVDDDGRGVIERPDTQPFLDQLPDTPPAWRHTAIRAGAVTVIAGDIDVAAILAAGRSAATASAMVQALNASLRNGAAVSAELKLTRGSRRPAPHESSNQHASNRIAAALETAMRTRAGDGNDPLNAAPYAVAWPSDMTVAAAVIPQGSGAPDFPVLLVNLHTDPLRTTQLLDELEAQGFTRHRELDSVWPLAPAKWNHLIWPSQYLLLGTGDDGQRVKLFFERFATSRQWYELVRRNPAASVGILVYSGLEAEGLGFEELKAAAAAGGVVAFASAGMAAV